MEQRLANQIGSRENPHGERIVAQADRVAMSGLMWRHDGALLGIMADIDVRATREQSATFNFVAW
jgi:hypothetical protein